jgi:hypothetical protein
MDSRAEEGSGKKDLSAVLYPFPRKCLQESGTSNGREKKIEGKFEK